MSKLYLQSIVEDILSENLPVKWQGFEFRRFSNDKTLFDFQQAALKNALKALHLYFKEKNADKIAFFKHYENNGFKEDFNYDLNRKQDSRTAKYLLEYAEDYPVVNNKISFAHFINRMSFWMATGSGKTLVIVKLIELLSKLIADKELPDKDILFLTHRDDLLEQFKKHIDEFNSFNFTAKINLKSLKEYVSVKRENSLPFAKNEINVFYYRSDLISDEHKEKIVNFRNYDNSGKWYIILDEAHKGDKEDSKRQILYSILSRNGFLFNFSATFTDPRDFATCAYNFNLSKFVEEGYGKHIYVSSAEISAFRGRGDGSASLTTSFSEIEKQKIVLKTLLLLTYINKHFKKIRNVNNSLYHRPLLLTLVNSVDVEDSDLELFFRELEKVAKNEIRADLLRSAKQELVDEFNKHSTFEFEDLKCEIDSNLISELDYKDILKYVLNAETAGNIEVLKIPGNRNELIFKLKTAEIPFALIKIGDISSWLKEKLKGYELNESFENESYFKAINRDDSNINILMGSRSFYEGWDSNRPNIILFVNIGVGTDAKKFVLQSVGRGVRIEPFKNQRKRLLNLYNAKLLDDKIFGKIKNLILSIESLFVFGTNAENLKEIIKTLEEEKQEKNLGEHFIVNPEVQNHLLLIPVYKTANVILAEENNPQRYSISASDFELVSKYFKYLNDKIALAKYDCEIKVLKKVNQSISEENKHSYFTLGNSEPSLIEPELILSRIFNYLNIRNKEFDKFKKLEDEIVHFRKIKLKDCNKYEEIKRKIETVRNKLELEKRLEELFRNGNRSEYDEQLKLFEEAGKFEFKNKKIKIKYLANHYYIPVILSESEKIDYINHIINVPSEVRFINELEEYLQNEDNVFKQFDWWMFSKLDETLDNVYIPYYKPKDNSIANFKPDFIFWAQKDKRYLILFVDPKGTIFANYQNKVDGYKKIFENKEFDYDGLKISTNLLLYTDSITAVGESYRRYWFDNFWRLCR